MQSENTQVFLCLFSVTMTIFVTPIDTEGVLQEHATDLICFLTKIQGGSKQERKQHI